MSNQFLREYELTVTPVDEDSIVITDLKISFDITKSLISVPNLCTLKIYNPNSTTLSALQEKFTKISLKAGYVGNTGLIFKGEIRNVFQGRNGVDTIITVYSGDGEKDWANSIFNKTYSSAVEMSTVLNDVFDSFENTTKGLISGLPEAADKLMGQTLSGSSSGILDNFADEYGFEWSIQDGEITVSAEDSALESSEAVLITATTGMIGTPTVTEIGADVTTLLNPKLLPNFAFKIESVNAEISLGDLNFRDVTRTNAVGLYKVQEVNFKGDSREGQWVSSVKGRTINA